MEIEVRQAMQKRLNDNEVIEGNPLFVPTRPGERLVKQEQMKILMGEKDYNDFVEARKVLIQELEKPETSEDRRKELNQLLDLKRYTNPGKVNQMPGLFNIKDADTIKF